MLAGAPNGICDHLGALAWGGPGADGFVSVSVVSVSVVSVSVSVPVWVGRGWVAAAHRNPPSRDPPHGDPPATHPGGGGLFKGSFICYKKKKNQKRDTKGGGRAMQALADGRAPPFVLRF